MKLFEFWEKAGLHNLKIFTPVEFRRLMKLGRKAAQELLSRYAKKSMVLKLRNNYYANSFNLPSAYFISNKIYMPSYISFETALSHYGLIPETVYEVTAATAKTTREFNAYGRVFSYHRIKDTAYTGYSTVKIDNDNILMADAEKAFVDYLYFVHLGKKTLDKHLRINRVNKKKVLDYSRLYKRKKFMEFVKNVVY